MIIYVLYTYCRIKTTLAKTGSRKLMKMKNERGKIMAFSLMTILLPVGIALIIGITIALVMVFRNR